MKPALFQEVSQTVYEVLDDMANQKKNDEKENRLVRMAKNILYEKYGDSSLSVSSIAEEMHVSSAYLSSL